MRIYIKYVELTGLILAAIISDIRTYKIKNAIVIFFITAGLATNLITAGVHGLSVSIAATVLPVPILFVLFALKMLGAGDIKLFCAIGSIIGIPFILHSMAYSFLCGGVMALIIMLVNKNFRERGRYLAAYIKACFLTRSLQSYADFNNKRDGAFFHFTYAIACGVLLAIMVNFL
jgi:Flp pilus assembly protein, protease CpaA